MEAAICGATSAFIVFIYACIICSGPMAHADKAPLDTLGLPCKLYIYDILNFVL